MHKSAHEFLEIYDFCLPQKKKSAQSARFAREKNSRIESSYDFYSSPN